MTDEAPPPITLCRRVYSLVYAAILLAWTVLFFLTQVTGSVPKRLVIGLFGLALAYLAIRAPFLRVVVRPDGLRVHNLWRNHRVSWAEVAGIVQPSKGLFGRAEGVMLRDGRVVRFHAGMSHGYAGSDQWLAIVAQGWLWATDRGAVR